MDSVKLVRKLWKPAVEKRTILYSERVYCVDLQLYAYSLKAVPGRLTCSSATRRQDFKDFTRAHINPEECIQRLLTSICSPQSLIAGFAWLRVVQTGGLFRPPSRQKRRLHRLQEHDFAHRAIPARQGASPA